MKAVPIITAGISKPAIRKMCQEIQNGQHLLERKTGAGNGTLTQKMKELFNQVMRLQRDFAILDSGKPSRSLEPCLHLHSNCLILSDLICIHLFVAFFIFQPLRTARALCLPLQVKRHFFQRTAAIVHLLCLFSLLLIYLRFCEEKSRLQLYRCLIVLHFSSHSSSLHHFHPSPSAPSWTMAV